MAAAAALPEELVEEILLRLPPEEPASLFRVSVVCKPWCRLISSPSFRRRFRELHRTPPMLGFLCSTSYVGAHFAPTTAVCVSRALHCDWFVLDARHGRVLVQFQRYVQPDEDEGEEEDGPVLLVWDPITDEQRELPIPPRRGLSWSAAVLCAGAGTGVCHHRDCHRGPFLVVFVDLDPYDKTFVCTYSSDVDAWSEPISTQHSQPETYGLIRLARHPVLLGNVLYFQMKFSKIILKYILKSCEMSCIQLSSSYTFESYPWWRYMLTTTEEGVLGLVLLDFPILCMWLRKDAPEDDAGLIQSTVIDLTTTSPPLNEVSISPKVVGLADGRGIVFITVENDLYTIDLNTCEVELYQGRASEYIVPYMSFYTPELEAAYTGEGPSAGGSGSSA